MNKIVVVDIDGTLSKVGDRLKHIQGEKKDWDAFYAECFDDEPIPEIVNLVNNLADQYGIVFCTGRRDSVREETRKWLVKHLGKWADFRFLIMRPDKDHRHDTEVKPEQLHEYFSPDRIAFILEDRNSMVKKWRELGYTCLQVAEVDF